MPYTVALIKEEKNAKQFKVLNRIAEESLVQGQNRYRPNG